jgi:hypothetical protein
MYNHESEAKNFDTCLLSRNTFWHRYSQVLQKKYAAGLNAGIAISRPVWAGGPGILSPIECFVSARGMGLDY